MDHWWSTRIVPSVEIHNCNFMFDQEMAAALSSPISVAVFFKSISRDTSSRGMLIHTPAQTTLTTNNMKCLKFYILTYFIHIIFYYIILYYIISQAGRASTNMSFKIIFHLIEDKNNSPTSVISHRGGTQQREQILNIITSLGLQLRIWRYKEASVEKRESQPLSCLTCSNREKTWLRSFTLPASAMFVSHRNNSH